MSTKQELEIAVSEATAKAEGAVKAFEALRSKGTAAELVKAGALVTSTARAFVSAEREHNTFALVGIYESIKAAVLKLKIPSDTEAAVLLGHDVDSLNIHIPFGSDGVDVEKVGVNTLGRKTRVASTGGGNGRGKNVYTGPDGAQLTSRELVELHGDEVAGEQAAKVLDNPALGLTYMADRVAKAKGFEKSQTEPTPAAS